MDQWLVRTSKNHLSGPFSKEEVCQLIQKRQLGPLDEICKANEYWFYLDEEMEVIQNLGIRLPRDEPLLKESVTETKGKSEITAEIQTNQTQKKGQVPAKKKMSQFSIETLVTWRILVWGLLFLVALLFYLTIREIQRL